MHEVDAVDDEKMRRFVALVIKIAKRLRAEELDGLKEFKADCEKTG